MHETTSPRLSAPLTTNWREFAALWSIPLALLVCIVLAFIDKVSIAALFTDPQFQRELGLVGAPERKGMLMTSFLFAYGISSMLMGTLGDRISPKKYLIWIMLAWGVLMVAMGMTSDYHTMLALRILLGIAEGPLFALAYAIVKHTFPKEQTARATVLWVIGTPLGATIGFPLTIFILGHGDWRTTFFVFAALTLAAIALVLYVLRDYSAREAAHAQQRLQQSSGESVPANRALFANWKFWLACLFNMSFLTYLWGINSWLPSYLVEAKGIAQAKSGLFIALPFAAMLIGELIGAVVSDRYDRRALQCLLLLFCAGLGLGAMVLLRDPYWMIAAMSFSAFCWGGAVPSVFALLSKVTDISVSSTAGGIFNGAGNIAGAFAPVLIGTLIAQTGGMHAGIWFLTVMALAGSLVLLPLARRY